MPKSTKRFVLSNQKLNSHGFVVITAGIDLTDFLKNPIMFWMHSTPEGKNADELLPIGFWEDIKVNGEELSAIPNFDDSDDFAMKIYNKVEHGTIRAASVELDPITLDKNKANWVAGQKLPTVLTSKLGEASIVDRGANADAVTLSYGSTGSLLRLSKNPFEAEKPQDSEPAKNETPKPKKEHTHATKKVLFNALAAGKIGAEQLNTLLDMKTDKETVNAMYSLIKRTPINHTGELKDKYHPAILNQATRSYDDINRNVKGGFNDLKRNAPELYKAKMFEGTGELPYMVDEDARFSNN